MSLPIKTDFMFSMSSLPPLLFRKSPESRILDKKILGAGRYLPAPSIGCFRFDLKWLVLVFPASSIPLAWVRPIALIHLVIPFAFAFHGLAAVITL